MVCIAVLCCSLVVSPDYCSRESPVDGEYTKHYSLYYLIFIDEPERTPMKYPVITSSPEIMSGAPVFAGTRVPVQTFLDYIKAGESIEDFLEGFPTVQRQQIVEFLEEISQEMMQKAA